MLTHEITSKFPNIPLEPFREFCFDPWTFPKIFPEPISVRGDTEITAVKLEVGQAFEFIQWAFGIFPIPWKVKIVDMGIDHFVDEMVYGPFRYFKHEHIIFFDGDCVIYTDRLSYACYGGSIIDALFIRKYLRSIFALRHRRMKQLTLNRLKIL